MLEFIFQGIKLLWVYVIGILVPYNTVHLSHMGMLPDGDGTGSRRTTHHNGVN